MIVAGVLVVARESIPAGLPVRTGAVMLIMGLCLALTAGTFGLGPSSPGAGFDQAALEARGGILGQSLYWASTSAASTLGAHLLAVFLLLAGAVLVSGVSLAALAAKLGRGAVDATKAAQNAASTIAPKPRARTSRSARIPAPSSAKKPARAIAPIEPPEPEPDQLVIRATHVEAGPPPVDLEDADDIFDDPVTLPPEPEAVPIGETADLDQDPSLEAPVKTASTFRVGAANDPMFKWRAPAKKLLVRSVKTAKASTAGEQRETATTLVESLGHHGVEATVTGTVSGPHITRFELRLAPGIKMNKVANLRDDLAYALASTDIRILAPIPGKQAVGVEVPNKERQMVTLGDVWQEPPADWSPLTVWLGKDVAGRAIGADLAKMPHLLVAGTTGAGKSGAVNAMLSSVLLRATPQDVRLLLVDPKQVELNHYESIPHLLTPVITNPKQAANALQNLVREMEQRYALMAISRTRKLTELNASRVARDEPPLPYILCVIDELADLMMVAPADVEDSIIRLAQKARAVGIHLVLATQSPRVDVITGMIKANVPSRIAFAVSSQTDSRVILDQNGAESLLGQGDMLFAPVGSSRLQRIQGAFIDEAQIAEICEHWRRQGEPAFVEELLEEVVADNASGSSADGFDPDSDDLLGEAILMVAEMQTASTSMLQRRLRVGYTRAGRLIDMLERRGVISGYEGSKPRQVLISEADVPSFLEQLGSSEEQPLAGSQHSLEEL
jgi:S-DNA-T family DNA segregation ATPase FtsK/SpoIIIE